MRFGPKCPRGFLPVYSVDTEEEVLDITPRLLDEEQKAYEARVGFARSMLAGLREKLLAAG